MSFQYSQRIKKTIDNHNNNHVYNNNNIKQINKEDNQIAQ